MSENTQQRTILLIDDDHYVIDFYADAFRNSGYDVDIAIGAAEALRKLRSEKKYDVVVLDVTMIAISGLELMERIRSEKLSEKSVFIVLTNDQDPDKMEKAKALGIDTYLIKSSTVPIEAVRRVNQVIENKEQSNI